MDGGTVRFDMESCRAVLKPRHHVWAGLVVWVLVIFVTSCFLVTRSQLIGWVRALSGDGPFSRQFALFWMTGGFLVVKAWHATEYAILFAVTLEALKRATTWSRKTQILVAFGFCVLFAASDEWHQTFVPDRDGCLRDVVIDSVGASLAAVFAGRRRVANTPRESD